MGVGSPDEVVCYSIFSKFFGKNSKTVHNYVISNSIKQIRVSVCVYRFNQSIENLNSDN